MPDTTLEPDVEEIGEFSVLDIVIIGWVNCNVLNTCIWNTRKTSSRVAGNIYLVSLTKTSKRNLSWCRNIGYSLTALATCSTVQGNKLADALNSE